MTRIAQTFAAFGLIIAAFAQPAAAIQTIDCSVDINTAAERTICKSQRLQILDAKITEVYADYMLSRRVDPSIKVRLRESQYIFLSRRNACGADRECLEDVMSLRLSRIQNYI